VKNALGSVRERVMGAAEDTSSTLSDAGETTAAHMVDLKDRAVAKAEGNPLAVGLIAFGVGLLLASLIPASARERKVAAEVKDQAQPLMDEVADVAKEIGANLKDPAQDAATAVADAATDSFQTVKDEAMSATAEVKGQAEHARDSVTGR
jgi:ElaB/YqjD/DUF883 family membrane-anchored ribosome-binding protein